MRRSTSPRALRLMRLPGEGGPILRCTGELSVATVEALRRELTLILSLGYPALILNLSGCSSLDVYGMMTVLQTLKTLLEEGRHLVIVTGTGPVSRAFQQLGAPEDFPLYATESSANAALNGAVSADLGSATMRSLDWITQAIGAAEATPLPQEAPCETAA